MAERFEHVTSLDGLRFAAAAVVLFGHCFNVFAMPAEIERGVRQGPLTLLINGYGAVHVFFVLSGFCLAGSADRARRAVDLAQFYVRRVTRIHPPYVYALLVAWLASFLYDVSGGLGAVSDYAVRRANVHLPLSELWPYLLYPSPAAYQLGPAWTLAIEMHYSFLLPVMLLVTRATHGSVLVAISAGLLFERSFTWHGFDYAIFFALGIAVFQERERLAALLARAGGAGTGLLLGAGLAGLGAPWWFDFVYEPGFVYSPWGFLSSALGGTALLCAAIFSPGVGRALASPALAYGGRISYSFYLLHYPVMLLALRGVSGPQSLGSYLVFTLTVFVGTGVAAALSFPLVERPSIRLGNWLCRGIAARTRGAVQVSRLAT